MLRLRGIYDVNAGLSTHRHTHTQVLHTYADDEQQIAES